MQKSLTKNSIYNIIYTIANILFPFATSIYVSRILLPVGVGKVASAQNIVSYFVTLAALGLPSYGVREFAKVREKKHERNKLFTELLLVNIISTTLAVVVHNKLNVNVILFSGPNQETNAHELSDRHFKSSLLFCQHCVVQAALDCDIGKELVL